MIFSCRNCGKRYRIDMSAYEGHAVRWTCAKCGQEHTLKESDNPDEAVVAVGGRGLSVQSNTEEIFTITSRSTRRESDFQAGATVRSGGWHVTVMGQRQGPLSDYGLMELLSAGKINSRTYIWRSPMATWVRMKDLKEVEGLLAQSASGASARRDSGSWALQNTAPGIDVGRTPPTEPTPYDSRIVKKGTLEETTGKHGIRGNPSTPSTPENGPGGLADVLFRDIDNSVIDPRDANRVPEYAEGNGPWHSPRQEQPTIRDAAPAWEEITQPGKMRAKQRHADHTTTIVIVVAVSVVVLALIVAGVILFLNRDNSTGKTDKVQAKPVAAMTVKKVQAPAKAPAVAPVQSLPPSVAHVAPVGDTVLDESRLTAFVQEQVHTFSTCRSVMTEKPETAISVKLVFTVTTSGAIDPLIISPSDIVDPALNVCMGTIIRGWSFSSVVRPVSFMGTIAIP